MTQVTQAVPKGYKQTEIGVIPEDWDYARIDEKVKITTGSKNTQDKIVEGKYPFFVRSQQIEKINSYSFDGEAVLTAGDGVGTGKIFHYINGKFDVHQRVYQMSNFSNDLNGKYFFYQFSTRFYDRIMSMTAKSSVDSVRREMIAGMKIPYPTKPEQITIATALSIADALIEKLKKLIAKKKAVKQGTMQQLLTGKKRLPGFSGKWEVKNLGELFRVTRGQVLSTKKMLDNRTPDYKYPVYSSQTLNNGLTGYFNDFLFENAITWTTDGANAGDVKYRTGKFYCTNVCGVLISDHGYANWCVAEIFGMISKKYVSYVGNPKLMNNVVKNIPVVIPMDIKEQTAIAAVLTDMDAEIQKLESKLNKYHQIKTGMMQQLLTGKIRLVQN